MNWKRASTISRLICLMVGVLGFLAAWRLTVIGRSGIEDVPPPFILVAGLGGLLFVGIAVTGRYPSPGDATRRGEGE